MELTIFVVDAFTEQKFKGNPAAVIPLDEWISDDVMQYIATENNLSETAFIKSIGANCYEIRWFSPLTEIDFCGHATLASSFVLFNYFYIEGDIEFVTLQVGQLTVKKLVDGRIEMSFPNQCPEVITDIPQPILAGLSIKPIEVLQNRQAYVAVLATEQDILTVEYDSQQLRLLAPYDLVVTAATSSDNNVDFVSRYFWPANGGDEDPVTGSIHAGLAPYWADKLNKKSLVAFQASPRGGTLYCHILNDRVLVSGFGILYLQGKVFV